MTIKFKAFVTMEDKECGWNRIIESMHDTELESKEAALHFDEKYPECATGIHKYYIFSKEEWRKAK